MTPTPVTKESALHMAKAILQNEIDTNKSLGVLKKMALQSAVNGDSLNEIFDKLYSLGFCVSADKRIPHVQGWFQAGHLIEKK